MYYVNLNFPVDKQNLKQKNIMNEWVRWFGFHTMPYPWTFSSDLLKIWLIKINKFFGSISSSDALM